MKIILVLILLAIVMIVLVHMKSRMRMRGPEIAIVEPHLDASPVGFNGPMEQTKAAQQFHRLYQSWLQAQPQDLPRELFMCQGEIVAGFFADQTQDEEVAMRMCMVYAHASFMGRLARKADLATPTTVRACVAETAAAFADMASVDLVRERPTSPPYTREFGLAASMGLYVGLTDRPPAILGPGIKQSRRNRVGLARFSR